MFNKTLVVYVGNIYRSPTVERLLRQFHLTLTVSSASFGAPVGKDAGPYAISVARAHNPSLGNHCARQITGRMCREHDLILITEEHHIFALCKVAPEMHGKVMLFGHWDSERETPDPCRKSRGPLDAVHALLERSARQRAQVLNVEQGKQ